METETKRKAPPPSKEEVRAANAGEYAGNTRVVKKIGGNKALKILGAVGATAGAGTIAYETVPAFHQAVDSSFLDNLKGQFITEVSVNPEVFDNSAAKGKITGKNTIQMTREEYAKIAPPMIDRTNVKQVPVEFATPGGKRNLTFERGTSVNAMIYIKTPEGQIRDVTYEKITNSGKLTGDVFPNCEVFAGKKNEIQAGDIFPSPISGFVYLDGTPRDFFKGEKLEEGAVDGAQYRIEGDYVDRKGNKFRVHASVNTLGLSGSAITKALVSGIPNSEDFVEGNPNEGWITNTEKLNKARVKVNQGGDLFKFITPPPFQHSSPTSLIQAQVKITFTYEGDISENGRFNTFGGKNCNHPTLDNKAIVLK